MLFIVKNYTGDVINFGIAAERLHADGIEVGTLVVAEDIGTSGAAGTGMRGTAATMIVEKVLGAAADAGATLTELLTLGDRLVSDSRSLAVAYAAQHDRETGQPAFVVGDQMLEFGVGIHGERASAQLPTEATDDLVDRMIGDLLAANPATGPLILLVNGLGGMSNLDLANVAGVALAALDRAGAVVESLVIGTYVSALDMRGFSLTLTQVAADWLPYWYAGHDTPALPRPRPLVRTSAGRVSRVARSRSSSPWALAFMARMAGLRRGFDALDAAAGDGDFGDNLLRGLRAGVDETASPVDAGLAADLSAFAAAFGDDVGGSSGPLFGVLFQAVAAHAANIGGPAGAAGVIGELAGEATEEVSDALARGLAAGAAAVSRVGGAELGDRTMIDALAGFVTGVSATLDLAAAERALRDAEATAGMRPRRGRATYLADRIGHVPDAGALAVAGLVIALSERLDTRGQDALWVRLEAVVNQH